MPRTGLYGLAPPTLLCAALCAVASVVAVTRVRMSTPSDAEPAARV